MSIAKITPFLWFTAPQALHAAEFYVNLFNSSPSSKAKSAITRTTRYSNSLPDDPDDTCRPSGADTILTVEFELAGQKFVALNGNKEGSEVPWKFNHSISFSIACDTQAEIDHFWNAITSDGGEESYCGWCKDKWGMSWQVVPTKMGQLMSDEDPVAKDRTAAKMYTMRKLDIAALEAANQGKAE